MFVLSHIEWHEGKCVKVCQCVKILSMLHGVGCSTVWACVNKCWDRWTPGYLDAWSLTASPPPPMSSEAASSRPVTSRPPPLPLPPCLPALRPRRWPRSCPSRWPRCPRPTPTARWTGPTTPTSRATVSAIRYLQNQTYSGVTRKQLHCILYLQYIIYRYQWTHLSSSSPGFLW